MTDANAQEGLQQEESLLEAGNGLFLPSLGMLASAGQMALAMKNANLAHGDDLGLPMFITAAVTGFTMWAAQPDYANNSLSSKLVAMLAIGALAHGGAETAVLHFYKNPPRGWHSEAPASAQQRLVELNENLAPEEMVIRPAVPILTV